MADSVQIASFESGELKVRMPGDGGREAVLALPMSRLIVKAARVPADRADDAPGFLAERMQAMSPFPDEPLTISCETVRETAEGRVVLAAALPESAADDIGEALDAAKLSITRVDSLALGELRMILPAILGGGGEVRRLVALGGADCISLFVLDGDMPVEARAILPGSDMEREIVLSLLAAEDFAGPRALAECVVAGDVAEGELSKFAPVRRVEEPEDAAIAGVAERSLDPASLNALPASWGEELDETRFKAKMRGFLVSAGVVWALVAGVLFGVPATYGFMTTHQKSLSTEHRRQYSAVKEMKEKVRLVQKYSDHSTGALEILKVTSDSLPDGIELTYWSFKRSDGVSLTGVATSPDVVYDFKDSLTDASMEVTAGDGEPVAESLFAEVVLKSLSTKGGRTSFSIDCMFKKDDETGGAKK